MTEYIERETLAESICKATCGEDRSLCVSIPRNCQQRMMKLVYSVPAADVEPVVHGWWIEHIDDYENYCECSICHYTPDAPLDETPRCPNCGAKMEEAR